MTLVLDLDETLVHFSRKDDKCGFLVRPFASQFLSILSQFFEIGIFTASQKEYADWILDKIDEEKNIKFRYYRESCKFKENAHLKDLEILQKDPTRIIIVDNHPFNL